MWQQIKHQLIVICSQRREEIHDKAYKKLLWHVEIDVGGRISERCLLPPLMSHPFASHLPAVNFKPLTYHFPTGHTAIMTILVFVRYRYFYSYKTTYVTSLAVSYYLSDLLWDTQCSRWPRFWHQLKAEHIFLLYL